MKIPHFFAVLAIVSSMSTHGQEIKGIYAGMPRAEYDALKIDDLFTIAGRVSADKIEVVFVNNTLQSFKFYLWKEDTPTIIDLVQQKFPDAPRPITYSAPQEYVYKNFSITAGMGSTATLEIATPEWSLVQNKVNRLRKLRHFAPVIRTDL